MSEKTRRAEHRKLRKAVGADAMSLMGAMSGILSERVFPAQDKLTKQLQSVEARMIILEAMVVKLQARVTAWEGAAIGAPTRHDALFGVRGLATSRSEQTTGAEVV